MQAWLWLGPALHVRSFLLLRPSPPTRTIFRLLSNLLAPAFRSPPHVLTPRLHILACSTTSAPDLVGQPRTLLLQLQPRSSPATPRAPAVFVCRLCLHCPPPLACASDEQAGCCGPSYCSASHAYSLHCHTHTHTQLAAAQHCVPAVCCRMCLPLHRPRRRPLNSVRCRGSADAEEPRSSCCLCHLAPFPGGPSCRLRLSCPLRCLPLPGSLQLGRLPHPSACIDRGAPRLPACACWSGPIRRLR